MKGSITRNGVVTVLLLALSVVPFLAVLLYFNSVPHLSLHAQTSDSVSADQSALTGTAALDNAAQNDNDEELIYLGEDGTIRVYDSSPGARGEITWESPEAGFIDVAAGDFNLDGDAEIVGIKNVSGKGKLIVYDPVISAPGHEPDGWFGDIGWETLATIDVTSTVRLVDAGELDTFFPGDELLYSMDLSATSSGVRVLTANSQTPDGTGWRTHISPNFAWQWDEVTVGNIDGESTDEVVLISRKSVSDNNTSRLHFYRVDTPSLASKVPFANRDLTSISWRSAAIGEVKNLGPREVVVVGETDGNVNDNIHVFNYSPSVSGGVMDYVDAADRESVIPNPLVTFLADITGIVNNQRDNEMFFLRRVPANNSAPRFFMRNQGNDNTLNINDFDLPLSSDNKWLAGTGGDTDGDGRDEVIIMRDNRIRIYTEPATNLSQITEVGRTTDSKHIIAANLDANGAQSPLRFDVSVSGLENGLEMTSTGEIKITIDSDVAIDFSASLASPPVWVKSVAPLSGKAPAEIVVQVDTTGLNPGKYTSSVRVSTDNPLVREKVVNVGIELNVLMESFTVAPEIVKSIYVPCEAPFGLSRANISVSSSAPVEFQALVFPKSEVSAAESQLDGPAVRARFLNNQLELFDVAGNSTVLSLPDDIQARVSASELADPDQDKKHWFSTVPWVLARSDDTMAPESIELILDPEKLVEEGLTFGEAVVVVVADEDIVPASFNDRKIPIEFLCANNILLLPIILQQDQI